MTTTVGKRIAAGRAKAKLTGKALGTQARVSPPWIRAVENGGIRRPAPDKLKRVADVLGLDHRELLALTDQLGATIEPPDEAPDDVAAAIHEQTEMLRQLLAERPTVDRAALAEVVGAVLEPLFQDTRALHAENERLAGQMRDLQQELAAIAEHVGGSPEPSSTRAAGARRVGPRRLETELVRD